MLHPRIAVLVPTRFGPSWPVGCAVLLLAVVLAGPLLAAGRPHRVLPLSGVTHMTPQEVVAENLLLLQLAFLREALGLISSG